MPFMSRASTAISSSIASPGSAASPAPSSSTGTPTSPSMPNRNTGPISPKQVPEFDMSSPRPLTSPSTSSAASTSSTSSTPAAPTSRTFARVSGMRSRIEPQTAETQRARRRRREDLFSSLCVLCVLCVSAVRPVPLLAAPPYFSVLSEDPGAWPAILSSIGLQARPAGLARVFVARAGAPASAEWTARVAGGDILILEGESSLAEFFGFRRAAGAVLWAAVPPGDRGYERFPYLLAALRDLGLDPPFRSARLWAFFDSAYRSRVDLDYFAARWRASGIAALHAAAWHFFESDPAQDAYLNALIAACHRQGILVYAWLELPHVSDKFWNDHPEWREKTALLQDAQLDWRKLMNLANPDCARAVAGGIAGLMRRFDWDGVNLAELYFESLEGIANPARFTPMNDNIRAEFRSRFGYDPLDLFRQARTPQSPFLDYRAALAARIEQRFLTELESVRRDRPGLDIVLTHVDDRFDTGMREAIGADASRVLPLLDSHSFTFLIEDPATVWNLGPQRYAAIADRYRALTPHRDRLAIDLNIVDRYQDVYPTKQQTGIELFQLVHQAAASFPRVALYFENSLLQPDLPLLPAAAAAVTRIDTIGAKTVVDSAAGVGLPWEGPAAVDGQAWPVLDGETVWLPAGPHSVEPAKQPAPLRIVHFNGELRSARVLSMSAIGFSYSAESRAIALFDRVPSSLEIDGLPAAAPSESWVLLPRGQHVVTAGIAASESHPAAGTPKR